ncbi:MAG: bifunctional metallophosphatase/5'-nucleotidase [Gemmobacter sp.]|jgi:5'-nucleotidase/UDP-sugar diphosphatase
MRCIAQAALAATFLAAGSAQAEFVLHVLHINDFHSRIEPVSQFDSTCSAEDDAAGKCFGGAARLATIIETTRAALQGAGENVIVLDAGDQFQGSLYYTTYKGAVEAEVMSRIGFDAMALGNHEFDDGPAGLADFLERIDFPVVSGNIDVAASNLLAGRVARHVVLEVGGRKVGIVSALATDTVETSSPGPDIVFEDEIAALSREVAALEAAGVEHILALNHVGLTRDVEIARRVAGIDAVIGGHSHTYLSADDPRRAGPYPLWVSREDGTLVPVVQAYAYGRYLGQLELTFDDAGALVFAGGTTRPIDASVVPDPDIAARIAELAEPIAALKAEVVAETSAPIDGDRANCRQVECEMGNAVTEAMLAHVRERGITIAIQNGGGLRASIPAGKVTMGDVLAVLPFQNTLATFEASGATIVAALENGVSQVEDGAGRFPQVGGLRFAFDPALPKGGRVSDVMVREGDGWVPIDPARIYGVVTNNYMRGGGDGYRMFATDAQNAYDFGPDLADLLAAYLGARSPFAPALDGRIARR